MAHSLSSDASALLASSSLMKHAHEAGSALLSLTNDHGEILEELILPRLDAQSVLSLGLTCRLMRALINDSPIWNQVARREEPLRMPACFEARLRVHHALEELHTVRAEVRELRAQLQSAQQAVPVSGTMRALVDFVMRTREPLAYPKENAFAREATKKKKFFGKRSGGGGGDAGRAIEKALKRDKKMAESVVDIVLISSDPWVSAALFEEAARSTLAKFDGAEVRRARKDVLALVLRVAKKALASHVVHAGAKDRAIVARVLRAHEFSEARDALSDALQSRRLSGAWDELLRELQQAQRRNFGHIWEVLEARKLMRRWVEIIQPAWLPSAQDIVRTQGSFTGARAALFGEKSFRFRLVDVSCAMLSCKRTRVVHHVCDAELLLLGIDACRGLREHAVHNRQWSLFEQLRMCEALANSRFFRELACVVLANVAGAPPNVEGAMLRARLSALHRNPTKLPAGNVVLFDAREPKGLLAYLSKAMGDVYLARNVMAEAI